MRRFEEREARRGLRFCKGDAAAATAFVVEQHTAKLTGRQQAKHSSSHGAHGGAGVTLCHALRSEALARVTLSSHPAV
eukprot:1456048-Pyramimonas_sp.AAC.1